jgi:UPF0716 protein FxsA
MPVIIFFLLAGIPIVEIALFIQAGKLIGLWPTLAAVIGTAVLGTVLLRHQGFAVLRDAQASVAAGQAPMEQVFDGACLLVGGALLLTPGFLTDAMGFALLVPAVRRAVRGMAFQRLVAAGNVRVYSSSGSSPGPSPSPGPPPHDTLHPSGPIIDAEYETLDDTPPASSDTPKAANRSSPQSERDR